MNKFSAHLVVTMFFATASTVLANEEWKAPSSPELYEKKGEVGEAPKYDSGFFIGTGAGFGQSRSTGNGDPIASFNLGVDVGYAFHTGSWTRWEAGVESFFGKVGTSNADMPIGVGLLAKIGHGYSLGNKLFGVWKLGVGPAQARYEKELSDGTKVESTSAIWGTALQASYMFVFPMSSSFSVTGGFKWTHYSFNVDEVEIKSGGTTVKDTADEPVNLNVPEATIGLRLTL